MSACGCGAETDLYVCRACGEQLASNLDASRWLLDELDITFSRRHRFGTLVGSLARSAETPVPYHQKASDTASALRSELTTWFRVLSGDNRAVGNEQGMARWLGCHITMIRSHDVGPEMVRGMAHAVQQAHAVVDRPPDTWYAGPCECGEDLNARSKSGVVACPACGSEYDIQERRDALLSAIEDQLATTSALCRALTMLGQELSNEQVRKWASRGKLAQRPPHPSDAKRRPRYRIGDVVDLLHDSNRKTS